MPASKPPGGQGNSKSRATFYGVAAVYLAYLYTQIAGPFLKGNPDGPSLLQFVLGTIILGGGAIALGLLAWRTYKAPAPEEPAVDPPEEDGE